MGKTQRDLSKKKTEKEKKIEKTEVTKPQRVYAFLTDPQSKLYLKPLIRACRKKSHVCPYCCRYWSYSYKNSFWPSANLSVLWK